MQSVCRPWLRRTRAKATHQIAKSIIGTKKEDTIDDEASLRDESEAWMWCGTLHSTHNHSVPCCVCFGFCGGGLARWAECQDKHFTNNPRKHEKHVGKETDFEHIRHVRTWHVMKANTSKWSVENMLVPTVSMPGPQCTEKDAREENR